MSTTRSGTSKVKRNADDVRHSKTFLWIARGGLFARAVVYLVLGALIIEIGASGRPSSRADAQGAFAEIGRQPAGPEILGLLAVGFAAYAVWRFVEACSGRPQGQEISPWTRVGWVLVGLLYLVLCVSSIQIAAGAGSDQGPEQHPTSFAAEILRLPLGSVLLAVAALAIASGGIGLIVWGIRHDYAQELDSRQASPRLIAITRWSGVSGNAARGIAVLLVASSLFASATSDDPGQAKSLDTALQMLAGNLGGVVVLALLGAGFLSFGLHSALEARFRRV